MNPVRLDEMESRRRRRLILGLIGFGAWQGSDTILHAFLDLPRYARVSLTLVAVAGAGLWIYQTTKIMKFIDLLRRDPALAEALTDERYRHAILRSQATAFWALLCTAGFLLAWSAFLPLPGRVAAQLFLIVAVCSATIALLIYDRE